MMARVSQLWIAGALLGVSTLEPRLPAADCFNNFQRGDSNLDNKLNLSDPIATLGYLFQGTGEPGCLDAADADDNGRIDLGDAVFTVAHLFLGGPPLPPPALGECGPDPVEDALACGSYPPCAEPGLAPCTSNDCCDLGSYCEKAVSECDGIGVCVPTPDVCPAIAFDPWCGCDGLNYGGRCQAAAAGVNLAHRGQCGKPAGCSSSEECEIDAFCAKEEGACDDPGQCVLRPQACPDVFDPVCGCDGISYSNDCEAAMQGASILRRGECREVQLCQTNTDCEPDQFCNREFFNCDAGGYCEARPTDCVFFFEPVCGCDGITYDNVCLASSRGVTVSQFGPCAGVILCKLDEECDVGSFCARREASCDDVGFCHADIDAVICNDVPPDPVCGCDNQTYANACVASARGVGIQRRSPCEVGGPCNSDDDCVEAAFCFRPEGFCDGPGTCLLDPTPVECQEQPESPVCGCDDKTYRNFCEANLAGVNVAYSGACDGIPRCNGNEDCLEDSYCALQEGWCGGLGKCAVRPQDCAADLVDLVCGCDKQTYRNECFASQAGVSIAFRGSCNGGQTDCKNNASCGGGSFCAKAEGDCDGVGQCDLMPSDCEGLLDPVCGCDGLTYDSECAAHAAGVNVQAAGPCAN